MKKIVLLVVFLFVVLSIASFAKVDNGKYMSDKRMKMYEKWEKKIGRSR